jgi:hypothetical protein
MAYPDWHDPNRWVLRRAVNARCAARNSHGRERRLRHSEALITARNTADQLHAHSVVIDFPDGTTEWYVRDGDGWGEKDA